MLKDLARKINCPEWADEGSRYYDLNIHDLWLRARFYDHIPYSFAQETDANGHYLKIFQRRPAIRLNIPILAANLVSRKLFAGRHAPRILHDNDKVVKAIKWMIKAARFDKQMIEAAYWGQSGSVALTYKIVDDTPCVNVWNARYCWPSNNNAEHLRDLILAYYVTGQHWLDLGVRVDVENQDIDPTACYWYVRVFDQQSVLTMRPVLENAWNPVEGPGDKLVILSGIAQDQQPFSAPHGLELVPATWVTALPGGEAPDGCSLFGNTLDNCIELDYDVSQAGRGGRYACAPQLMVKGRILNYEASRGGVHIMGPSQMLQLPADRKDGESAVSGADAKIIEMSAQGIDIAMEKFITHIRHWTHEAIGISRKDPDTITGTMSGKAMELIDEDFVDLVMLERTFVGDYGYLEGVKTLANMCVKTKHKQFGGVTEAMIDELENEWPELYPTSPQEIGPVVGAINDAISGGLMDQPEGRTMLEKHIDKRSMMVDGNQNRKPTLKRSIDAEAKEKTSK